MKNRTLSTLGIALVALVSVASLVAGNATAHSWSSNTQDEAQDIQGELQVGKTGSVILYVGAESGDYAAYCFTNDSEAGRKILAECKDRTRCAVKATVESGECKVPGLEADLSYSGRIVTVVSVKPLRRRRGRG